jgi:lipoyl-dependent peroxiredoxin
MPPCSRRSRAGLDTRVADATKGDIADLDEDDFRQLAERAKVACTVSRALRGVEQITVLATLAATSPIR